MNNPDRHIQFALLLITASATAGVLAGLISGQWLKLLLAVASAFFFIWASLIINRIACGVEGLSLRSLFLPPCKARLNGLWKFCYRCIGYYCGIFVAALLVVLIHINKRLLQWLYHVPPWLLLAIAFLLIMLTIVHGSIRRLGKSDPLPGVSFLAVSGFLASMSAVLTGMALYILLVRPDVVP